MVSPVGGVNQASIVFVPASKTNIQIENYATFPVHCLPASEHLINRIKYARLFYTPIMFITVMGICVNQGRCKALMRDREPRYN